MYYVHTLANACIFAADSMSNSAVFMLPYFAAICSGVYPFCKTKMHFISTSKSYFATSANEEKII